MKKQFKQLFCVFLVSLLLSQEVLADVAEPAAVASASDAEEIVDFYSLPEYDPLAGLTDEQYAAYCQTFIDHPSVLLEYPEGVPQPRFAVTLSAAAVYVLYLLAAAVGIVFTWNFTSWVQGYGGYDFFSGFEQYMRVTHAGVQDFWDGWDAVMNATWGQAISGMKTVYKYLKEYCVARMEGYGTEQPSYSLGADLESGTVVSWDALKNNLTLRRRNFNFGYPSALLDFDFSDLIKNDYGYYLIHQSSTYWHVYASHSPIVFTFAKLNTYDGFYLSSQDTSLKHIICIPAGLQIIDENDIDLSSGDFFFQFATSSAERFRYFFDFSAVVVVDDVTYKWDGYTITPEKAIVDVQEKTFTAPADTITLPADQAAADTIGSKVSAATDAATVTDALTGTWDLGETQAGEDTDDAVYPWVPDITGWLEKLKQGIDAIRDGISSIPDTLTNILDGIQAIPGQITDFFTVDTVAVSAAFAGLQDTFALKFPLLGQLQSIFSYKGQSFDQTPPIFTMQVPECLRFAYPDSDTFVVLDLTPYANYFGAARSLLTAALWLLFAQWVLNEFNIKFHVG